MKSASVRDLRQDFPRVLGWLRDGERVSITMRRKAIATIIPRIRKNRVPKQMPNLTARLRKAFGDHVIQDEVVTSLMDQNRGTL
jgi:antitoxin (DNA-binding transcriptional repressor) of toxin-antitoxin stability system